MATEKEIPVEKECYSTPTLTTHGDVDTITLGLDLGDDLDAAFTTSGSGPSKPKKKPKNAFS
jgi:hypothetical protein